MLDHFRKEMFICKEQYNLFLFILTLLVDFLKQVLQN